MSEGTGEGMDEGIVSTVLSGEEACPVLAFVGARSLGSDEIVSHIPFRAPHAWRVDPVGLRRQICMRCGARREESEEGERSTTPA